MKAYIGSAIKAHLLPGAFYLLLLFAVCVIPFALAQPTIGKRSASTNTVQLVVTSSETDRDANALPTSELPMGGPIWNQYNNPATEPPLNIGSQKFEPVMAAFDDQAADDFVITAPPPPMFLYITGVRVMGEYSAGGGPASSFNVYIYANAPGHLPGGLFASFLNRPYTGTPPDFTINLGNPFSLPSGTYWISVQAVQDFNPNGQWFWHNRTVQSNAGAVWQNPGDGYGTGCITWNRKNACMADQIWPDQVFQILGFPEGPTPTSTPTPPSSPSPTSTATATPTPVGCTAFYQDFDGVTPPTLPPGWTATNAINPDGVLWQTSNSGSPSPPADSPPNAAWVNDPAIVSDKRLNSPPVRIEPLENAALTFRHNYAFENGFDGGVLEISIDDGAFQDAAGFIVQGGYNGTISTCCGNPLAGRQAWTGSSGGFVTTTVELPQGHTSVFRWRMGSDNGGSSQGWRIDTAQPFCERPTPTSTPTVTAGPTATATPTPTQPQPTPTPSEPPCEVVYSQPACNSTVSTEVTDFGLGVSYFINGSAQPSYFTVNGIPANSASVFPSSVTFHFNASPVIQGENSMHLRRDAISCINGRGIDEFMCTFFYQPSTPTPTPTSTPAPRSTPIPRPRPTPIRRP